MINQYEKKNKLKFYVNTNKKSGEKTLRFHKGKKSDWVRHFFRHFIRHFFRQSAISFRQSAISSPFFSPKRDFFAIFFAKERFTSPFFSPKSEDFAILFAIFFAKARFTKIITDFDINLMEYLRMFSQHTYNNIHINLTIHNNNTILTKQY